MKTSEQTQAVEPVKQCTLCHSPKKTRQWLKFVELVAVGWAVWLNPEAGLLIFLLKICFQVLAVLQGEER
ncbi:MAG: hypothetical protein SVX43_09840 [Cyanobacteriota bacterium]|nr:hypothetical protein [Cyanobacteriota bacterium]